MRTLKVPAGIASLSHGDEQYFPNDLGLVDVSEAAAEAFTRPPHNLEEVLPPVEEAPAKAPRSRKVAVETNVTTDADASASQEG